MSVEIVMPKLGWTMEEGVLAEWLKQDGDRVEKGDILFTVETDKALNEVEAFDGGILRLPPNSPPPGSTVAVGTVLAYLVQPGEALPWETSATPQAPDEDLVVEVAPTTETAAESTERATPVAEPVDEGGAEQTRPTISPRARRAAQELDVDWTQVDGSGHTGRIVERDVRAFALQNRERSTQVTPVARRAAQELGVDLGELAATVGERRITREHVERAVKEALIPEPEVAGEPLSPVRRVIAARMAESAHTTAAVTLTTETDATELVRLREQLQEDAATTGRSAPSYTALLAKLVAHALQEHPVLNARLENDHLIPSIAVHVGVAVDTERGLLVPVVRDVEQKGLREVAEEIERLIEQARQGHLPAEAMRGSTFTITNLGMYEIDAFTPIINAPECAILGVGRMVPKQVVLDMDAGRVAIRRMMFLSLTFDHRIVDGAPAARFLQRVKHFVERPYLWLVT